AAVANVIVNERLVEQLFGHRDADVVGRTIRWGRPSGLAQIVGVVTDTHLDDLQKAPQPILYLPMAGRDSSGFELLVRPKQPVGAVLDQIRRTLRDIDPQLPLVRAWTFEQEMANALSKEQMI